MGRSGATFARQFSVGRRLACKKVNRGASNAYIRIVTQSIETTVNDGKAVVSADSTSVITIMQEPLWSGRSATFYVSPIQAQAVMRWYWTPGRIKKIGLEPVSIKERAKIESERYQGANYLKFLRTSLL